MYDNNNFTIPAILPKDPNIEAISKLILPFVRVIHTSWGKFKSSVIQKQSTALPAAYLTRYGAGKIEDTSGNSQKMHIQYAIAVVLYDAPQQGDHHAIYIENSICQTLQDYHCGGHKIENLKTADATNEAAFNNNLRILMVSFTLPLAFEPQSNKINAWLHADTA